MLLILISFLGIISLLGKAYRERLEIKVLKFKYRLYSIRDELRELTMNGLVNKDDWVFDYLDSSIAKTISFLEEFSIYKLLILYMIYHNNESLATTKEMLIKEFEKPAKEHLFEVYKKYCRTLSEYTYDKHTEIRILMNLLFYSFQIKDFCTKNWDKLNEGATEYPETSTLNKFCHQH